MLHGSIEYENMLLMAIQEKNQIIAAQAKKIQELNVLLDKHRTVAPIENGSVTLEE